MPSKAFSQANLLGTDNTLQATSLSADIPITELYANIDELPASGTLGEQAFVQSTNRLYIWNGSGWYNIALINTTPTWDSGGQPAASYELDADSPQGSVIVTLSASDPEGIPITYSYIQSGQMDSIATISQDSSVFTITPKTEAQMPDGGTGSITFRATDGVNILPQVSSFTLNFITSIENSKYTTLLVKVTDTSDNNNITDSSSNSYSITVNGDAHAGTFSPYRHGGYSVHLDDGEEISFPDSSNYNLSNGSFSIEAWVYPTSYDSPWSGVVSQFSSSSRGWGLAFSSTQITFLGSTNGGSSTNVNGSVTSSVPLNQWTHLLVTRDSNTIRIFNNGVLVNNFTESGTLNNSTNPLRIGELNGDASENFRGYIRDARVVKGSIPTEYQTSSTTNGTTIFSVPSETLTAVTDTVLLTCHLPYISDGSANDATPTLSGNVSTKPFSPYDYDEYDAAVNGGSVYFDGSGDYISIPHASLPAIGTDSFCVEFWAMWTQPHTASTVQVSKFTTSNHGYELVYSQGSSGYIFQGGDNNSMQIVSSYVPEINVWHHIAGVRDGSNARLYINGKLQGTDTSAGASFVNPAVDLTVGARPGGTLLHTGYISDVRYVHGNPVYTAEFTPPTAPLSTITNTEVHIKGTDASIIDKSQGSNLKLVGTTGSTTQAKFSNTKSMSFDGSGDYIAIPTNALFGFSTNDFTVEFWVYFNDVINSQSVYSNLDTVSGLQPHLYVYQSSVRYYTQGADRITSSSVATGQWYHVALSRSFLSTSTKLFINGTQSGSTYSDGNDYGQSKPLGIATYWNSGSPVGTWTLNGYIQDLRVTKGLARYTANFTPPTASLEG